MERRAVGFELIGEARRALGWICEQEGWWAVLKTAATHGDFGSICTAAVGARERALVAESGLAG